MSAKTPKSRQTGHSRSRRASKPIVPADIHPYSPVVSLDRDQFSDRTELFDRSAVAPLVGMAESFIKKVLGNRRQLTVSDVLTLLDQDAFAETFVPRSKILTYLTRDASDDERADELNDEHAWKLIQGDFLAVADQLPEQSIAAVVTSTPYWGMRIYKDATEVAWADGEVCAFGHEQTPDGFVRHSVEILYKLMPVLANDGSIWWNLMDTYMTRTQIRGNAYEALQAMDGRNRSAWSDHEHHRYSAGHSYIKDGEQCGIPALIAERASRIGYLVKSTITWAKIISLPEPHNSRVSRSSEYILHLTKQRAPKFDKEAFRRAPVGLGGRNPLYEGDKLSDVWVLPVSSGGDGHGAQFPIALPARCINISTNPGDVVLDPFVGSGTSGLAAVSLGRRFIGVDVSAQYISLAETKLAELDKRLPIDIGAPAALGSSISGIAAANAALPLEDAAGYP